MNTLHDSSSDSIVPSSDRAGVKARRAPEYLPLAANERDPLSDVLRTVRLTGALFFMWDVSWPFSTPVPDGRTFAPIILPGAQQIISYHILTEGMCWGGMRGEPAIQLQAGDVLLIPHGDPYVMANTASACTAADVEIERTLAFFRRMAAGELPAVVNDGGGGPPTTRVICGFLGCDVRPFNPMLAALPRMVRVRPPADRANDRLRSLVEYALAEARQPSPGSRCTLLRLSELLFVEVVRRCLTALPAGQTGWLAGLRDPIVGRALMLLHGKPAQPWSLETLADEVGISRSRLSECFTRLAGQPAMQYLAQWRIQIAARLLIDGAAKVAAVARDVGYESEAAFSRAFKRLVGVSPAQWRQQGHATARRPKPSGQAEPGNA
jgi:AraC-like DNA-binding protein